MKRRAASLAPEAAPAIGGGSRRPPRSEPSPPARAPRPGEGDQAACGLKPRMNLPGDAPAPSAPDPGASVPFIRPPPSHPAGPAVSEAGTPLRVSPTTPPKFKLRPKAAGAVPAPAAARPGIAGPAASPTAGGAAAAPTAAGRGRAHAEAPPLEHSVPSMPPMPPMSILAAPLPPAPGAFRGGSRPAGLDPAPLPCESPGQAAPSQGGAGPPGGEAAEDRRQAGGRQPRGGEAGEDGPGAAQAGRAQPGGEGGPDLVILRDRGGRLLQFLGYSFPSSLRNVRPGTLDFVARRVRCGRALGYIKGPGV